MATSLVGSPATGYRQTIFTRHAPTIAKRIKLFFREFDDTEKFPGTGSSRENAIVYLREQMAQLRLLIPSETQSKIFHNGSSPDSGDDALPHDDAVRSTDKKER